MPALDLPPWFVALLLFPFGLVVGSFGNVLIHRLPQEAPEERDVVAQGSRCPSCRTPIKPWHNVPLLGWLWLRGKCAACGWCIPFRYPLVELLGGLIFAASAYLVPVGTLIWLKFLICGFALLVLFFTDLTEMILPDAIQFPLMALGVLMTLPQLRWADAPLRILMPDRTWMVVDRLHNGLQPAPGWSLFEPAVTWKASLLGLAVGYGLPALVNQVYKWLRKTDGLGMGDFKMLAWLGAFWGLGPMLGILFLASFLGSAVGLPLMFLRKEGGRTMIPFGCFLALATPVIVFFGHGLWLAYLGWATGG